jgi:hypothetical protein
MPKSLDVGAPLSPQRAFVIQLHDGATPRRDRWTGRVEHVISGQAALFGSLDELLTFIEQVLAHERESL